MSEIDQENQKLRDELTALKEEMKAMTAQMKELMILKTPISTQAPSTVLSLVSTTPISTTPFTIPESRPWGMSFEEIRPLLVGASASATQQAIPIPQPGTTFPQATAITTYATPIIHVPPYQEEPIYHGDSVGGYDRVDDLQDKLTRCNER